MDSKGNFVTVKPADALVRKYVSCYYFHVSNDPAFTKKFFFYPNYNHALTAYKGSTATLTNDGSRIEPSASNEICCFYTVNVKRNLKVELNGVFNKIGVVFNPLGINHFLSGQLGDIFNADIAIFNSFGTDFHALLEKVFFEQVIDEKVCLLDTFFSARYIGLDEPLIKSAVAEILNTNGSVRVEELSDALHVNRKTLLRLFKKHLCCSIEEYKKLVMFRNALNYSQQAGESATLTDVALYSLYYDQAHFIKHFKSVTKLPPKQLLSNLTKLGSQEVVYWHFED